MSAQSFWPPESWSNCPACGHAWRGLGLCPYCRDTEKDCLGCGAPCEPNETYCGACEWSPGCEDMPRTPGPKLIADELLPMTDGECPF